MRKNAALFGRTALIAGLLLVSGLAGVSRARAAAEQRPWLGVYMQELTSELREGMDYRGDGGVIVSRVVPDGPAERAGLRKGDVIVRVNSRTVDSPAELQDVVRAARVGQSVSVEVFRNGERRILSVRLDARPGDQGGDEPRRSKRPKLPKRLKPPGTASPEAARSGSHPGREGLEPESAIDHPGPQGSPRASRASTCSGGRHGHPRPPPPAGGSACASNR